MAKLGLSIREVADKTGVTAHTLRYYERIGLILPVTREPSGHRRYDADEVRWVELLKRLHGSGMPIRRMLEFARLKRRGDVAGRRALLDEHRVDLEARVAELQATLRTVRAKLRVYDLADRRA
ncbi:MAG TPA: MerR family transcriptional regulator [Kofleriaceae bacterium]